MFFGGANEIKIGFKQRTSIVKNDDGTLITHPNEVVYKLKSTFAELLNKKNMTTVIPEPDIIIKQDLIEPTDDAIEWAIQMLKNGKSPREHDLVSELLKKGGQALTQQMGNIIRKIWKEEILPVQWNTSILYPIYLQKGRCVGLQKF